MVVFVVGFQRKREDILSSSIQTRSKAHGIIKRMLASLGDPYTRFLSPAEFLIACHVKFFVTFESSPRWRDMTCLVLE